MTEIERKFRVERLPDGLGRPTRITQAYLALDADAEVEVRVRRAGERRLLTVKRGSGLERDEVEIEIDAPLGDELAEIGIDRSIAKDRHELELPDGLVAEVDRFIGALDGLCIVEVEFPDRASADRFVIPSWFGDELTGLPGWSNAELASRGLPPPA